MSEPDLDSSSPIGCAISSVLGTFTYIVDDGRRHIAKNNVLGRIDYENVIPDRRELMVSNARLKKEGFLLERNGFQLVKHISTVSDFLDQKTLNMIYRKEIERLILDFNPQDLTNKACLRFSICACHPCAGAMLILSVSFQF